MMELLLVGQTPRNEAEEKRRSGDRKSLEMRENHLFGKRQLW